MQVYDASTMKQLMKLKNADKIEGDSTVISGLAANTRYLVKVRAKNREGYSDFADDLIIRTRGETFFFKSANQTALVRVTFLR